jgi:amino acid permease
MLGNELLPAADHVLPRVIVKNGIVQTSLLIIANCAGAGILSLPKAINHSGLVAGSVLVVCAAILSAYTADILGRCYSLTTPRKKIVEGADAYASEEPCESSYFARSPYAAIGWKAAGAVGAAAVTLAQVLTQFCVLILFLLISGINLNKLIPQRSSLFFSLVGSGALAPLMLLRPGHVWGTAILAILASVVLVVVVVILCATDAPHDPYAPPPAVTFSTFGSAFGVILFGFGGHAILPALQATMLNPTPARFRKAIVGSFAACTSMYLASSIGSVLTLGGAVGSDILTNFSGPIDTFGLIAGT